MFLFSSAYGYQDVATLGTTQRIPASSGSYTSLAACLPHYTASQTFFYPAFNAAWTEDAVKFVQEFSEVLAMPIILEAAMRVRASKSESALWI